VFENVGLPLTYRGMNAAERRPFDQPLRRACGRG
jgi:hypothetical protein